MTQIHDAPPSDDEVLEALGDYALAPTQLIEALVGAGYEPDDVRRAIRRCMNRGTIRLAADFDLEVAPQVQIAA